MSLETLVTVLLSFNVPAIALLGSVGTKPGEATTVPLGIPAPETFDLSIYLLEHRLRL